MPPPVCGRNQPAGRRSGRFQRRENGLRTNLGAGKFRRRSAGWAVDEAEAPNGSPLCGRPSLTRERRPEARVMPLRQPSVETVTDFHGSISRCSRSTLGVEAKRPRDRLVGALHRNFAALLPRLARLACAGSIFCIAHKLLGWPIRADCRRRATWSVPVGTWMRSG